MIPAAFNFRDLSEEVAGDGLLAPGRVFRSDLMTRLDTGAAHRHLESLDVGLVIDLRTSGELDTDGSLPPTDSLRVEHRSLLDEVWSWDDERNADHRYFLRDRTIHMYERHGDRIIDVIRSVGSSDRAAVVHCTAGKDRTGTVSSALLGLLGAEPDRIVADYARSSAAMARLVEWYRADLDDPGPIGERERVLLERGAAPDTMEGVVAHVVDVYGSFAAWGRANGFTDDEREELQRRLRA